VVWSYAIEELSILATWKRETNLNSCENIEKKICGPGFPQVRSSKNSSSSNTLRREVELNLYLLLRGRYQRLHLVPHYILIKISLLDKFDTQARSLLPSRHTSPFFWFPKTKSSQFCIQFVKNNASKGEFQNFFKEATAYAGLALIPTLYRFFKNTITTWLIFKY
jgi:hypothetical protein